MFNEYSEVEFSEKLGLNKIQVENINKKRPIKRFCEINKIDKIGKRTYEKLHMKIYNLALNGEIKKQLTFKSIEDMGKWYDKNIKTFFSSEEESFEERLKSAFIAAEKDNVKRLILSFGVGNIGIFEGNIDKYIRKIEELVHCPVVMFSVGPDREQTVVLREVEFN